MQIFLNIADGAKSLPNVQVSLYPLKHQSPPEAIKNWLAQNRINVAIALGNRGYAVLPHIPADIPVVTGALLLDPDTNGVSGISLSPSPESLFAFLRRLLPHISRVRAIYLMDQHDWLMGKAAAAAKKQRLTLKVQKARSMRELADHYKTTMDTLDTSKAALWLPHTSRGIDRALMQQILATAWERNMVVFSSNFSDVKRGVLFSLYPDNVEMGKSLARMAIDRIGNRDKPHRIILVDTLQKAINFRTADHIGLHFTKTEEKNFDFTYPPQ